MRFARSRVKRNQAFGCRQGVRHVKLALPCNGSLFDRHRQLHSKFRGEVVPVERGSCVAASTARSWMSCCISRSRFRGGGLCDTWTNSPGRRRTTGRPGDGTAVTSRTTGSPDSTFPTQTLPYRVSCAVPRVSRSAHRAAVRTQPTWASLGPAARRRSVCIWASSAISAVTLPPE